MKYHYTHINDMQIGNCTFSAKQINANVKGQLNQSSINKEIMYQIAAVAEQSYSAIIEGFNNKLNHIYSQTTTTTKHTNSEDCLKKKKIPNIENDQSIFNDTKSVV